MIDNGDWGLTKVNEKPEPPETVLDLINVSHRYQSRKRKSRRQFHQVLDNVTLSISEGEVIGIVGRNGAGKTTLLRLMAGVLEPDQGAIRRVPGYRYSLLSLGLGFRNDLTGRDNAYLSALLQGVDKNDANACLDRVNEFAELGDSYDEPVKTYSAGMRARLGFAIALQTSVDVLLIDEILSVGDRRFREKASAALADHINAVKTAVLVSHVDEQLKTLCDSLIWIEDGVVQLIGDPPEVLSQYNKQGG